MIRNVYVFGLVLMVSAFVRASTAQDLNNFFGGGQGGSQTGSGTTGGSFSPAQQRVSQGSGNSVADQADVGSLSGSERFLRDNREFGSFVGRDSYESAGSFGLRSDIGESSRSSIGRPTQDNQQLNQLSQQNTSGFGGGGTGTQGFGTTGIGNARFGAQSGGTGVGGLGGNAGFGNTGLGGQQNNALGFQNTTQAGTVGGTTQAPLIPTRTEVEFQPRQLRRQRSTALNPIARLQNRASLQRLGSIEMAMRGRTLVLSGIVPTERARALAAQVVLLEPGVADVENRLQVADALPPAAESN